ncbi:glycine cleavage system protein H [Thiohalorhabdus denitrificans]|uniref:Glycine cleavage system H protein n=1 Tax=Thiohalorhabdus denitrificans TaxID=381306 RepID=A0A0P9EB42_9GAMM|nr:glycine cleavage system protein GcvH [Thiohalorhabdus denitrificans]KPV39520.1 glycine cleavage system protein H [Thiohalorhabdus denitrificans]SCX99929.1 glycine cleavage system H protein [Thiohalorhabdus denitrificans]
MDVRDDRRYTKSHEWVKEESDGTVSIGITDYAQDLLSDVVFVELPETGNTVATGDEVAVAESVKAASDIYAPISGEIVAANEDLEDSPEKVNEEPFDGGWIFRMKPSDQSEVEALMGPEAYRELCESEE